MNLLRQLLRVSLFAMLLFGSATSGWAVELSCKNQLMTGATLRDFFAGFLAEQYSEHLFNVEMQDGLLYELYVSEEGSWTLVKVQPETYFACFVEAGEGLSGDILLHFLKIDVQI